MASLAIGATSGRSGDARNYAGTEGSLNVLDFGAKGNGQTDDADAILATIAAAHGAFVQFPPGQYLLGRELVLNDTVNLVGAPGRSLLIPTKNAGVALSISTPGENLATANPASIFGLTIDGSRTRGTTGMLVGATGTSGRIRASHLEIRSFRGPHAVGLRVCDCVDSSFEYSYFGRNTVNVHIEGNDPSLPTLTRFHVCSFREADTVGVQLRHGYMTSFLRCLFESNKGEGVEIKVPPKQTVLRTSIEGSWFENNHHLSPDQANRFHVLADGTDGTAEIRISGSYMAGVSRAIRLRNTVNFVLDDVLVQPVADTIVTEGNNCNGVITNMPLNVALQLERLWKNTAERDMIVVNGTRGIPPTAGRMVLDGWSFPVQGTIGPQALPDGLGLLGRTMVRRGHITRIVANVIKGSERQSVRLEVQRSNDSGHTWQSVVGTAVQFLATPGSHVSDIEYERGLFHEGDFLRVALLDTADSRSVITGSVAIEVEVDSWSTAIPTMLRSK
jgi:hypothetical protein